MPAKSVFTASRGLVVAVICVVSLLGGGCASKTAGDHKDDAKKADAALTAGLQAHAKGDLVTAAKDYNTVLQLDPTNKYAMYNLGLVEAANGNYGNAETDYRRALASDAAYEPALFNLAILRKARGDNKEAEAFYRRAVAADPKDAAAQLNLGLLLRATGNTAEGNIYVLRAIAMDPKLKDPRAAATPARSPVASPPAK
jgi:Tfp pilus assembly protein PilF